MINKHISNKIKENSNTVRHWNNGTDHRHSKSCCDKSSPARRTMTVVPDNATYCRNSKDTRIDVDMISIRRENVGSISNWRRSEGVCYIWGLWRYSPFESARWLLMIWGLCQGICNHRVDVWCILGAPRCGGIQVPSGVGALELTWRYVSPNCYRDHCPLLHNKPMTRCVSG